MGSKNKILITLTLLSIFSLGCSVFSIVPTKTPTSPAPNYSIDGKWLGYTQNGGSVLVEIANRTIEILNLDVLNPNHCEEFFSALGSEFEIQGNNFNAEVALYRTEGIFVSNEVLSGTIKLTSWQRKCYDTAEIQWLARKSITTKVNTCEIIDTQNSILRDEPILITNAKCLTNGSTVLAKYAPGDLIPPGGYYVWLPEFRSVVSRGPNWEMWDPISGAPLSQLIREGNSLLDPTSLKPIVTWSTEDLSYVANTNLYKTIDIAP